MRTTAPNLNESVLKSVDRPSMMDLPQLEPPSLFSSLFMGQAGEPGSIQRALLNVTRNECLLRQFYPSKGPGFLRYVLLKQGIRVKLDTGCCLSMFLDIWNTDQCRQGGFLMAHLNLTTNIPHQNTVKYCKPCIKGPWPRAVSVCACGQCHCRQSPGKTWETTLFGVKVFPFRSH